MAIFHRRNRLQSVLRLTSDGDTMSIERDLKIKLYNYSIICRGKGLNFPFSMEETGRVKTDLGECNLKVTHPDGECSAILVSNPAI